MNLTCRLFLVPLIALLSAGLLSSCAGTASGVTKGVLDKVFEDEPPKVVIRIKATPELNPDYQGRPSPIVVRIYALKADDIFKNADFFALYEQDTEILGDDMTSRDELEIPPGESRALEERELDIGVRHVGVIAAYRDLDNAVWRGTIDTPVDEVTYIDITLDRLTMTVNKGEKKGGWF